MKRIWTCELLVVLVILMLSGVSTFAQDTPHLKANLVGFQEVPPKLTDGAGEFKAVVDLNAKTISYTLTFSNLTSTALFSHIHFGQHAVNGAIYIFLCGGPTTPVCPAGGGTVTGTITAADVLAVSAQNITAGDFEGAIRIIQSGDAYVNVHTTNFPAGEIRGQVHLEGETEGHGSGHDH